MRDFTERTLDSKLVYDGKLLEVREDNVSLPDGQTALREYIVHPGAVIILPMLDEHTVLVERQFRYPLHQHFLELPAGKIDPGEAHAVTARRELLEETGFSADRMEYLTAGPASAGLTSEVITFFRAVGVHQVSAGGGDETEQIVVHAIPLSWLRSWLREREAEGLMVDYKIFAGLYLAGQFPS